MKPLYVLILFSILIAGCGNQRSEQQTTAPSFPKNEPQQLTYETVSKVIQDMKVYVDSVKRLQQTTVNAVDSNYRDVVFETEQKPLFLNVYPDPKGARIIFLLVPKEPTTGSNYLLTYEKKLPVIESETVELQMRSRDPEQPFNCSMQVADTAAYMTAYPTHDLVARYRLNKRFLQSGTYDFDALTVPSYRTRGYAFIVFDVAKVEVSDRTANLTATCSQ